MNLTTQESELLRRAKVSVRILGRAEDGEYFLGPVELGRATAALLAACGFSTFGVICWIDGEVRAALRTPLPSEVHEQIGAQFIALLNETGDEVEQLVAANECAALEKLYTMPDTRSLPN
ncbi:MAG TPA: hypothetical protein VG844_19430 [Terracidiphilus sp.]|nr:hypothetical protein [Terracidiphilus sp.]